MAEDVKPSQEGPRWGLTAHSHTFRGGVTIAALALVLLLSTFIVSSPTVPRILAILTALVGVGAAAGLVPIRGPQDFYGGLVLVLFAGFSLVAPSGFSGPPRFFFRSGAAPPLFFRPLAAFCFSGLPGGRVFRWAVVGKYK